MGSFEGVLERGDSTTVGNSTNFPSLPAAALASQGPAGWFDFIPVVYFSYHRNFVLFILASKVCEKCELLGRPVVWLLILQGLGKDSLSYAPCSPR